MAQPANVLAFLDFSGAWDPRLMFVMGGALTTFAVLRPSILRLGRSRLGASFPAKASKTLDARLIGGAVVFGLGWGIVGFCPGPAVVAAGSGSPFQASDSLVDAWFSRDTQHRRSRISRTSE